MVRFTLIGVPSSAGTYGVGLEKAPLQLRRAGPIDRLLDAGLDVVDDADLPLALYRRLQGPATSRWAPNARTCLPLESSAGSSNLRPVHVRAAASDWTPTPEWIGTVRDEPDWVTRAKDRAARAKAHELAAHRRAEQLHEQAAKIQERLGHADRAQAARERAEHARELHAQALREQAEADQRSTG